MFIKMGSRLIDENLKIAVTKNRPAEENIISCEMPSANGNVFMSFINEKNDHDDEIKNFIRTHDDIIRIYSKNKAYTGLKYARNIYMGDYCYNSSLSEMAEDMGKDHEGIRRLAVLRSDVDNLGKAFISGFENISSNDPEIRYKNVTISRTASFSRQMSMFFRYFINLVLEGRSGISGLSLSDKSVVKKKVNIVYSGGDDVLLIGYWSDVIEAAANIRDVFEKYCSNALTVSSGIGIFTVKYPVSAEARITGELVDKAKEYVSASGKEKDALDLFSPEDGYVFSWDEFKQKVIEEKYRCIAQLFNYRMNRTGEDIMRGNAMLYKLLKLLRGAGEKINIARYAYMLTRLEPDRKNEEYFMIYKDFSKNMYRWILNKADRKELIAAIYIYVYITRNWEADKNGNYANCV
jgi:CRISPR-associated protein Csm1